MRKPATDHYFYILGAQRSGAQGPTKVGVSQDVTGRMRLLQTGCPFQLHQFHAFAFPDKKIAHYIEGLFIETEADVRLRGDWFSIHPVIALARATAYVDAVVEMHLSHAGPEYVDRFLRCIGIDEARAKLASWGLT